VRGAQSGTAVSDLEEIGSRRSFDGMAKGAILRVFFVLSPMVTIRRVRV